MWVRAGFVHSFIPSPSYFRSSGMTVIICLQFRIQAIEDLNRQIVDKMKQKEQLEMENARLDRLERILKLQTINLSLSIQSHSSDDSHISQLPLLLQVGRRQHM